MRSTLFTTVIFAIAISCMLTLPDNVFGQENLLEVEGGIKISDVNNTSPDPGTIRWTGTDFQGWNGVVWVSLGKFKIQSIITDIDGNEYRTIQIGVREWMAENLRTTRYRNGTPIPKVLDNSNWSNLASGAYCWYNNDSSSYDNTYGKLYNWYAVIDTSGLCPTGWHVPSDNDWTALTNSLEQPFVGAKLKEEGTAHWINNNPCVTNESGFSALPGGSRGADGSFTSIGEIADFWSNTSTTSTLAWYRELNSGCNFSKNDPDKRSGLSIRCLKD